ncbi:MAG: hypothetical protein ABIR94_22910 [Rubrivivax sp.]
MCVHDITTHPIHLGMGASAEAEPRFTATMDWYADYGQRHTEDGIESRLVSMHTFSEPWTQWEMHPQGSEVVLCTRGIIRLHQQLKDGTVATLTLAPGEYALNDPGVWHTADVEGEATALFITAGLGTQHRPR